MIFLRLRRAIHTTVSRKIVQDAIRKCIGANSDANVDNITFGNDLSLDLKIILAASRAADITISDNTLASLQSTQHLMNYLCKPRDLPSVKGVPKFELFNGEELPPNVTLLNYRKRRWSDSVYQAFVKKAIKNAGLLKDRKDQHSIHYELKESHRNSLLHLKP